MNKRFLLALLLCVSLFWLWQYVGLKAGFLKPGPEPEPEIEKVMQSATESTQPEANESPVPNEPQDPITVESTQPPQEEIPYTKVALENQNLRVVLENQGGLVHKVTLKDYYQSAKALRRVQLVSEGIHQPGEIYLEDGVSTGSWMFETEQPDSQTVVFTARKGDVQIQKRFHLDELYGLTLEVTSNIPSPFFMVVSEGLQPVAPGEQLRPSLLSFGAINPKYSQVTWSQESSTKKKDVSKPDLTAFQPINGEDKVISWLGMTDNYFANVFLSEKSIRNVFVKAGANISKPQSKKNEYVDAVALQAEGSVKGMFYMGPLNEKVVENYPKLENVISFGWAGLLSKGLFVLLKGCHNVLGNWGWSIIVLTFFIKLVLMPLTLPGIKSSYKMRKLQPKIKQLRAKYSGDDLETKQKMNQEMFKLYKEEGVNPFGSCITGIVQMPIFFAYFSLLRSAFELRQAPWIFWINDLSGKDPSFVLILIMGATMYFSMQAMQMSMDPMQERMMKFMPIIFTLFFIGMPSGLILYMITSNLYTLFQTYFFKRRYEAHA